MKNFHSVQALYDYWVQLGGRNNVPSRDSFDPMKLTALLPFMFMVENKADQTMLRLIGSMLETRLQKQITGNSWDTVFDNSVGLQYLWHDLFLMCFHHKAGFHLVLTYELKDGDELEGDVLVLPFEAPEPLGQHAIGAAKASALSFKENMNKSPILEHPVIKRINIIPSPDGMDTLKLSEESLTYIKQNKIELSEFQHA